MPYQLRIKLIEVTPYMGVWIEIDYAKEQLVLNNVTPYMGVWIEITSRTKKEANAECHSLHGSVD